jgi:hypothetical protein
LTQRKKRKKISSFPVPDIYFNIDRFILKAVKAVKDVKAVKAGRP